MNLGGKLILCGVFMSIVGCGPTDNANVEFQDQPASQIDRKPLKSTSVIYPEGEFVSDLQGIASLCDQIDGFAGVALVQASVKAIGRSPTPQELYDISLGSLEYLPALENSICYLHLSFKSREVGATAHTGSCRVTGLELQPNRDVAVSFCE